MAVTTGAKKPKRRGWQARAEAFNAYVFMSPVILGLLLFTLGPMIISLALSFSDYNLLNDFQLIGFDNYVKLFNEELFWQSLRISAIYSVVSVPLGLTIALFLAILLNKKIRGIYVFRSMYYLPTVISGVGVAMLWKWIFNGKHGIINNVLGMVGVKGPNWLLDEQWALFALIITSVWGVGGTMLIFLAGLQGIPFELMEAAEIDGANRWSQFRHITLPLLSNVTFFNLVLGIIGALQYFTDAFVITGGGPNNATLFIAVYLYRHAFTYLNFGYAAAISWVLFLIVMLLTLLVFRSSPLWVFYESERKAK
ncbi:MAG: sugar ABC transporter permease [Chloroflexi bacterium]|nr:MAG: sugar ABC transporter permease [Chloroflexota bacterium]RLT33311.1 MAG: sugar ABC transporter permease [Chloroflexota bacterium]